MDAAEALADLTEISSQIEAAVLADAAGTVAASTIADDERSREIARLAVSLLSTADEARTGLGGDQALSQVEVALTPGSIFVVREGGRVIAATTSPEPTTGLVFYDLRSCLRNVGEADEAEKPPEKPEPKTARRRTTRKAKSADAGDRGPGDETPRET